MAREHIIGLLNLALNDKAIKPEMIATMLPTYVNDPIVTLLSTPMQVMERQVRRFISLGYQKDLFDSVNPPISVFALLVVPRSCVPLKQQMRMAGLDTKREDIYGKFKDCHLSSSPYWIYNISKEQFPPIHTVSSFQCSMKAEHRRGLDFIEGVNLFAQNPGLFLNTFCSSFAFFGSALDNKELPEISIFSIDPAKDLRIGPNCYCGGSGNYSIAFTCSE